MDEFTQYLGDSCLGSTSLENIEPTIASLDRVTVVERVMVAPWAYGSQPCATVELLRDQENVAPGKKGKRRSAECEK